MTNYLFIDKDDTLGEFWNETGIYPNVTSFLEQQVRTNRKIVIATTATVAGAKEHLKSLDYLINCYIGREHFISQGNSIEKKYVASDGAIHNVSDDYYERMNILSQSKIADLKKKMDELLDISQIDDNSNSDQHLDRYSQLSEALYGLIHKQTSELFDDATTYQNPYQLEYVGKDLHLSRRYLAPRDYDLLRTVMIGDLGDGISVPQSDPFTPVVVINPSQREGNWLPVGILLDSLYSEQAQFPWEVFDLFYAQGTKSTVKRSLLDYQPQEVSTFILNEVHYDLDQANGGRRIVIKP